MPIGCLFMLPNSKICCFFWLELLSSPSLWLAKTMERGKKECCGLVHYHLWSLKLFKIWHFYKKAFNQILPTNQHQLIGCKDLVEHFLKEVIHYLPLYFRGNNIPEQNSKSSNYGNISKIRRKNHYLEKLNSKIWRKNYYLDILIQRLEGKTTTLKFCHKVVQFSLRFFY